MRKFIMFQSKIILIYAFLLGFILCGLNIIHPKALIAAEKKKNTRTAELANRIGMEFIYIKPGSFQMGSPFNEAERYDDEKQHLVKLTKGFYLQTAEVTQGQWLTIMGYNPSHFQGCETCPVENVSWGEVQEFIRKLNKSDRKKRYRLPTEAEWEYACRAGEDSPFAFGMCLTSKLANYAANSSWNGCQKGEYRKKTLPVASLGKNAWGLYDMHGNVAEWCQDSCKWIGQIITNNYYDKIIDPICIDGPYRILRGGGWGNYGRDCRSAVRSYRLPHSRLNDVGFRLICKPS